MNWDQIEGNWKQFTGKAREQWGDLTDDEVQQAKGNREQLAGVIQKKWRKHRVWRSMQRQLLCCERNPKGRNPRAQKKIFIAT